MFCGEELLIVTSSELRPAANTLQSQRQAQGYLTRVQEVGARRRPDRHDAARRSSRYIRSRLNGGCLVKPSYVILFGNTAHVPTFLVPCSPGGNPADCNIASDLDYSLNGIGTDLFADVQLGRLPAPNLDARQRARDEAPDVRDDQPRATGRRLPRPRGGHVVLPAAAHLRAQRGRDRRAELQRRTRRR